MTVFENQQERVQKIKDNEVYELTEWEEKFIDSLGYQMRLYGKELSEKQLAIVEKIESKIKDKD